MLQVSVFELEEASFILALVSVYCLVEAPKLLDGFALSKTSPVPSGRILILPFVSVLDIVFPSNDKLSNANFLAIGCDDVCFFSISTPFFNSSSSTSFGGFCFDSPALKILERRE